MFGEWMEIRRKELGLTQEGAAHAAGVSVSGWRAWEGGRTLPGPVAQGQIARALEVAPIEVARRALEVAP